LSRRATAAARRLVAIALAAALVALAASFVMKRRLVEPEAIDPVLLRPPEQGPTTREPFTFTYRGRACRVRPVAEYRLSGLVVSHNDVESFADIYHDTSSVDTKDLCLLWGRSLETSDFHQVDFSSGPFTCYFRYPQGIRFDPKELANNHLITDDDDIRTRLGAVHVGDQVRLAGLLVDYQMEDWRDVWRETSTTRNDDHCEVVFVDRLDVLRQAAPRWHRLYRLCGWLLAALPALYVLLLWLEVGPPPRSPGAGVGRARR
jgi:hypothetical protein